MRSPDVLSQRCQSIGSFSWMKWVSMRASTRAQLGLLYSQMKQAPPNYNGTFAIFHVTWRLGPYRGIPKSTIRLSKGNMNRT